MRPAVFFDLGWTLGEPPSGAWDEFHLYPETVPALRLVNDVGWCVVIVSNQKSIALGRRTLEQSQMLMDSVKQELAAGGVTVDASYVCPHCDEDECGCRKPKTALFEEAAELLGIDVAKSWVIGDLWRDVAAAHALGARSAQVMTSHRAQTKPPAPYADVKPDIVAANVLEAVREIQATDVTA